MGFFSEKWRNGKHRERGGWMRNNENDRNNLGMCNKELKELENFYLQGKRVGPQCL